MVVDEFGDGTVWCGGMGEGCDGWVRPFQKRGLALSWDGASLLF